MEIFSYFLRSKFIRRFDFLRYIISTVYIRYNVYLGALQKLLACTYQSQNSL